MLLCSILHIETRIQASDSSEGGEREESLQ